jgi:hypothetical protein
MYIKKTFTNIGMNCCVCDKSGTNLMVPVELIIATYHNDRETLNRHEYMIKCS